jgi:oligoribonuclease (3'-5' exoribonuclease)
VSSARSPGTSSTWSPAFGPMTAALADILESIEELKFYRRNVMTI